MATYVNDLRLKEITTGDEAGTWGTSTNTNLKLIGEALGYGTENCFAGNINTTVTVADGASDNLRAMYFKATSSATLTATRTLTIAPNTISRVMLIENATTGGQSIAISQGTGSNVTIPNGQTKMVYLDGAGAGASVVDAFADFSLPTVTAADLTATTADINGGTIDGATLGGSSQVTITDADMNGGTIDGVTIGGSSAGAITGTTGQFNTSLTIASPGGSSACFVYTNNDQSNLRIKLENSGSGGNTWELVGGNAGANNADLTIYDATNTAKRAVFSNNGDISFYEDTGTTPKFFWDASAESLGIGTTSPLTSLSIETSGVQSVISPVVTGQSSGVTYGGMYTVRDGAGDQRGLVFQTYKANVGLGERVRIDSDGNLGVGTSSPGAKLEVFRTGTFGVAYQPAVYITNNSSGGTSTANTGLGAIAWATDSNATVTCSIEGIRENPSVGASSGLVFRTGSSSGGTESMRITSAGNVGIGSTGPVSRLEVVNSGVASLYVGYNNTSENYYDANIHYFRNGAGTAEHVRIDASGNLLVGTTSTLRSNKFHVNASNFVGGFNVTNGTGEAVSFFSNGTVVGSISVTASATAYNTSSDARLKENIADAESASERIDAIQVRQFDWKADGSHQDYGMIAQELMTVAPEAVSGDPESDEMMGVDYSKLVPMMLKEIQSLRARVAQLEGA